MNIYILTFIFLLNSKVFSKEPYPYASKNKITLRSDYIAKCMMSGLNTDANTIYPDQIYRNNYRSKNKGYSNYYPPTCAYDQNEFFTKYLMISEHRICDYESGQEKKLREWIIQQEDNSIDPVLIFKKSIELNQGHIFNTLLTIHQLLRNEARWRSKRYYFYKTNEKENAKFWRKFIDIRGDLSERDNEFEGDHEGSWYRIWGIALYRLSLEDKVDIQCGESAKPNTFNSFKSSLVGISAELSKYLFDAFGGYKAGADRPGKSRINNFGSKLGSEIIKLSSGVALSEEEKKICNDKKYIFKHFGFSPNPPTPDNSNNH